MTQTAPSIEGSAPVTVAPRVSRLVPYSPGKPVEEVERELGITGIIKLASNENSLGPSPKAIDAVREMAPRMHHYPDASCYGLRTSLSERLDIDPAGLVFGNGSDDLIHLLGITFLEPGDEVIQGDPSFVRYEAAAILNEAPCHLVRLTPDWVHDLDAMADRINAHTRLIFIANPNNPTGTIVTRAAFERFLERVPDRALVVMDEAYYEYAAHDPELPACLEYVRQGRNVVVLRTFSKAYGLAGFRIGWGAMRPETAGWLNRTREPFNVNYMAQTAATAALTDTEHVARTVAMNEAGKRDLYAAFDGLSLTYAPTHGNFVWVDVKRDSRELFQELMRRGVIVRSGDVFGAPNHLRVTIGTAAENARFVAALTAAIST